MTSMQQFQLHPSVIFSLIREQAGTPEKAIAELVMNSIDAGATKIYLNISATQFSIRDNGLGFKSGEEIDNFFATFGTPHQAGDAKYGQFRLGRGQCFGISRSVWRSGNFGMEVDLGGLTNVDAHGFTRSEYSEFYDGCLIEGVFYQSLNLISGEASTEIFDSQFNDDLMQFQKTNPLKVFCGSRFFHRLTQFFCLVDADIYLNDVLVTRRVEKYNSIVVSDTDTARINLIEKNLGRTIYLNQGIFVLESYSDFGSLGFVVDLKQSPNLNIARNQINFKCPVYAQANRELSLTMLELAKQKDYLGKKALKCLVDKLCHQVGYIEKNYSASDILSIFDNIMVYKISRTSIGEISLNEALRLSLTEKIFTNNVLLNTGYSPKMNTKICEYMDEKNIDGSIILHPQDIACIVNFWHPQLGVEKRTYFDRVYKEAPLNHNLIEQNFFNSLSIFQTTGAEKIRKITVEKAQERYEELYLVAKQINPTGTGLHKTSAKRFEQARMHLEEGLNELRQNILNDLSLIDHNLGDDEYKRISTPIVPIIVPRLNHGRNYEYTEEAQYILFSLSELKLSRTPYGLSKLFFCMNRINDNYQSNKFDKHDAQEFNKSIHDALLNHGMFGYIYDALKELLSSTSLLAKTAIAYSKVKHKEYSNARNVWKLLSEKNPQILAYSSNESDLEKLYTISI